MKTAVMKGKKFFLHILLIFSFSLLIPVSVYAEGYVVQPATPDMITGPSQELTPVSLWDHPPRVLAIYLVLFISPLLVFPIELVFFLKLFTYLGYRKIVKKNVLDNSSRSVIFHYIRESPGTDFTEISRETGVTPNSLRYHLAVLKLMNKVTMLETSRNTRYYENSGIYPEMEQKVLKYLHNKPTRTLLKLIKENPNLTRVQLESALGVSGAGVNWHMHRLSDDGILVIKKAGRNARYEINNEVLPYLEKHLAPFDSFPEAEGTR